MRGSRTMRGVRPIPEPQLRRSFVNCSRGEANGMTLPRMLCQTTQSGSDVSLFTARRAGETGRQGNTVGTYMCADLGCAARARTEIPPWLRERDPEEVAAERTAELEQRVHGFLDAVLR